MKLLLYILVLFIGFIKGVLSVLKHLLQSFDLIFELLVVAHYIVLVKALNLLLLLQLVYYILQLIHLVRHGLLLLVALVSIIQ